MSRGLPLAYMVMCARSSSLYEHVYKIEGAIELFWRMEFKSKKLYHCFILSPFAEGSQKVMRLVEREFKAQLSN